MTKDNQVYIECSDVTKFDSIYGSHVVRHRCIYCNRETMVCAELYSNILFKSLDMDKCPYEIPRTG